MIALQGYIYVYNMTSNLILFISVTAYLFTVYCSTLQMLTNIENRLEELFEMIETMPQDKVEAAEKVRKCLLQRKRLLDGGRGWAGFFLNEDYNSMVCFILYQFNIVVNEILNVTLDVYASIFVLNGMQTKCNSLNIANKYQMTKRTIERN